MDSTGRFVVISKQIFDEYGLDFIEILQDTKTGVLYVYRHIGNSGGLTVLVDAQGKPQMVY